MEDKMEKTWIENRVVRENLEQIAVWFYEEKNDDIKDLIKDNETCNIQNNEKELLYKICEIIVKGSVSGYNEERKECIRECIYRYKSLNDNKEEYKESIKKLLESDSMIETEINENKRIKIIEIQRTNKIYDDEIENKEIIKKYLKKKIKKCLNKIIKKTDDEKYCKKLKIYENILSITDNKKDYITIINKYLNKKYKEYENE